MLDAAGGFCGDPVGKCLRERHAVAGVPLKDIQLCLRDSDTMAACIRGESLALRFSSGRAQPGWLIWVEDFSARRDMLPHEVLVDWEGGVFCQAGTRDFGCLSDVRHCLYAAPSRRSPLLTAPAAGSTATYRDADADLAALRTELEAAEPTTREALIQARRGQGRFRDDLLFLWNKKCAVTKCAVESLLRASHIKPWRECSDHRERLDRFNGLLLSPNLDAAFDRGWISFADDGALLLSPRLPTAEALLLGLTPTLRLVCVYDENRPYLAAHRALHGF